MLTAKSNWKMALQGATVLLLLTAMASAQRIKIEYTSRGKVRMDEGTLKKWTYRGLEMKGKRSALNLKPDQLVSVVFSRMPEQYEEGLNAKLDGNYRAAQASFLDFLAQPKMKRSEEWAIEHAHYNCWFLARRLGALADAKKHAAEVIKSNPQSNYLPELRLREAEDAFGLGIFDKAEKAFSDIALEATQKNWASKYAIVADLSRSRCFVATKRVDDAKRVQTAVVQKITDENLRLRADVIRGEILIAKNQIDDAKSLFAQLVSKADYEAQPILLAGASNGLGDCFYAGGKYKEACFEYSKTFALYSDRDDVDHELGWAYWRFANACKQIAANTNDPEEEQLYKVRFRRIRQKVAEEFRMTRGGQLARAELGMDK